MFTVLYCAWTECSCVVPILHRTVHVLHYTMPVLHQCCHNTRFRDAMRYVSRYLGHNAIRIAILVYRVNQCLFAHFSMRSGNAIYRPGNAIYRPRRTLVLIHILD